MRAFNFVFEDTVEYRVREVLEQKLSVIFEEFGVDKTSDVLDSAEAGHLFDSLYVEALLHPENLPAAVERLTGAIRSQADEARRQGNLLPAETLPSESASKLPIGHWMDSMVCHYLDGDGVGPTVGALARRIGTAELFAAWEGKDTGCRSPEFGASEGASVARASSESCPRRAHPVDSAGRHT